MKVRGMGCTRSYNTLEIITIGLLYFPISLLCMLCNMHVTKYIIQMKGECILNRKYRYEQEVHLHAFCSLDSVPGKFAGKLLETKNVFTFHEWSDVKFRGQSKTTFIHSVISFIHPLVTAQSGSWQFKLGY